MKRPGLAATAPFALAFFLTACGSISGIDDLFQDSSGAGGSAATTAGQGGATSVATGVGGAASTAVSSSSGPATTSGSASTGQTTTGSSTSSQASTGPGSPASSSTGGPTSSVYCNNNPCAAGEVCCYNLKQQNDHCGQPDTCGDGFVEFGCNGPEDCPGGVCCADIDIQKNPPYKGISCQQSCNSGSHHLIVCSDANPSCPQGTKCESSQYLGQGYKVCK